MKQSFARCLVIVGAIGLALVGAGGAEAQAVKSGAMELELASGGQLSYLGIDLVELEESLCLSTEPTTKDPKLVVANDGGHTGRVFSLDVGVASEAPGGTPITVPVTPGVVSLAGPGPLVTGCGSWSYRLTLDPLLPSSASTLTLARSQPSDASGSFTGSLSLATALELTPDAGGAAQWRFYTLTLDLAGSWGFAAPLGGRGGSGLPANASNLVLFAQKSGLVWVKTAQAVAAHSAEDPNPGELILQPTDTALGWLNAPR
jgi:hypothetical protein